MCVWSGGGAWKLIFDIYGREKIKSGLVVDVGKFGVRV